MLARRIVFVVLVCGAAVVLGAQANGQSAGTIRPGYELYSWQGSSGDWEFCLLYNTETNHTADEVFNERIRLRGLRQLKKRLSKLHAGTTVFWPRTIVSKSERDRQQAQKLNYPPASIVEEVRQYALTRHLKLDVEGPVR